MESRLNPILLKSIWIGFGAVMAVALLGVGFFWYSNQQTQPKPWVTSAIFATAPPKFRLNERSKTLELYYIIENSTDADFKLPSLLRMHLEFNNDTLSQELTQEAAGFRVPLSIPAKSRVNAEFDIRLSDSDVKEDIPNRVPEESEFQYRNRLLLFMNDVSGMGRIKSIRVYDDVNRYLIVLPRWESR